MTGEPRRFTLRITQRTLELCVDLTAQLSVQNEQPSDAINVAPRTWIRIPSVVNEVDRSPLVSGLATRVGEIEAILPVGQIVVCVLELSCPEMDYQPDAVALAMLGWVSEEIGLRPTVEYDSRHAAYVTT